MQFPTTVLSNGIRRPLVMLHLTSSSRLSINVDALVDTGADVTLLSDSIAAHLGIDLTTAPAFPIGSALGTIANYRTADVIIELRRKPEII